MSYSDLLVKTWERNVLFSVLLELTYRCNLDCFFCYNDVESRGRALTLADYLRLLGDLQPLSTMNVTLTGGEPLASPDFFALGRAAREQGFVVRVKTNGHAMRPQMALRVKKEIDPFNLDVSLHGARPETHDRQTRVPGSFERLLANLRTMQELELRVQLNATLTAWNEDEIEDMYALADALGLRLNMDTRVTPRDDGDMEPLSIYPSADGIARLLALQNKRAEQARRPNKSDARESPAAESRHHCGAGAASVTIDPCGNVYPCVQWRKPVGNLHEQTIKDIWLYSTRLEEVRKTTAQAKAVVFAQGEEGRRAGFCPALAEQLQGSAVMIDPATIKRVEILRRFELP